MLRPNAIISALLLFAALAGEAAAQQPLSAGQTLYLPVYSHLYHGEVNPRTGKPSETLVSTHVAVRNTDPRAPIRLTSARYYNTGGKLLREYLPQALTIPPLGTHELFVPRSDSSGGSGANFMIDWAADRPVNPPLVEALHADIREARTLIFITTGQPVQ